MSSLDDLRRRYREVHGDEPISVADDRVLGTSHEAVTGERVLADMAAGRLPMPPYLLRDGTPVTPPGHLDPVVWAGGAAGLHEWYVGYWPGDPAAGERGFAGWMSGRHGWFAPATPRSLRRVRRWQAQAQEAVTRLSADPRDPVGRGSLAEAVDALDGLLAPDTDVERARHGGTSPREEWVDRLRRDHLTPAPPELPIRTERLVLRRPVVADAEDVHACYGREDVARFLLSDAVPRPEVDDVLRRWADPTSSNLTLVIELDGRVVGDVQLMVQGPSTAEIGWALHPDVHGRGIATEAASALLEVGFGHYGFHRIYADLDARNGASARLCERLGLRREVHRLQDVWSKGEWTDSFQYGMLASEWAAAHEGDSAGPG